MHFASFRFIRIIGLSPAELAYFWQNGPHRIIRPFVRNLSHDHDHEMMLACLRLGVARSEPHRNAEYQNQNQQDAMPKTWKTVATAV